MKGAARAPWHVDVGRPATVLDRGSLLESALDAIVTIDGDHRIHEFNPSAEQMFGFSRREALGRRLPDLIIPERFRQAHEHGVARAAGDPSFNARPHRFEVTALHADGREFPVELTIAQACAEPFMLTAFIRDLTDRHRAEAALRRSEERFMRAFEDAPVAIALVSVEPGKEGRVLHANRALCALTGYSEMQLMDVELLAHPEDAHASGTLTDVLTGRGAVSQREQRIVRVDGAVVWTLAQGTVAHDAEGTAIYGIAQFHDITERRALEQRLRHLADHDPLTGLLNRRGLERALTAQLAAGGALLVLDLDHFKFVNDSFGHSVGDDVIRAVATLLRGRLRPGDRAARLGGDEFAVVLDGASVEDAAEAAERLIAGVEGARPNGLPVSVSIGVAAFAGDAADSPSGLLVAADIALYEAKNAGRGRARVFAGKVGSTLAWVERIRAALDEDRLVLYTQPIIDLATYTIEHEELLVRMLDEQGNVLSPDAFLPTAEAHGLIGEIDRWVMARAVELAAAGRSVHVNLSGASIGSSVLLDELAQHLRATGAQPGRLVVELTETCAIANIARAQTFAMNLRALGCRLALDDFGTGFGSFTYLKHLPADYLKIDREFVGNLAHSAQDRRVVDSIVAIAGAFGQQAIAEGVEDQACVDALRDAGVGLAQGYHFGRPVPVAPPPA